MPALTRHCCPSRNLPTISSESPRLPNPRHIVALSDHFSCSHTERNCGDLTQPDRTFVVGLCSGLWAAAAVSITPSLPDLVHVGTQTVLLAFRTGTYVHSIAQRLEPASNESKSWTRLLAGTTQEEVAQKLDAYHTAEVSAPTRPGQLGRTGPPVRRRS